MNEIDKINVERLALLLTQYIHGLTEAEQERLDELHDKITDMTPMYTTRDLEQLESIMRQQITDRAAER